MPYDPYAINPYMNFYKNNYPPMYPSQQPQPQAANPYAAPASNNMNNYTYVNGIEGAKAFQVAPGQTVLLIDSDNPIFYFKTSNSIGQSSIRMFKFEEIHENDKPNVQYATMNDFNNLKNRVDELFKRYKGENKNEPPSRKAE